MINYEYEEPSFTRRIKKYKKFFIKSYEVCLLFEVLKNKDLEELTSKSFIKPIFMSIVEKLNQKKFSMRIEKISINTNIYPY